MNWFFCFTCAIILYNLKSKHRRCMKLYFFGECLWWDEQLHTIFIEIGACFNFDPCGTLKVNGSHLGNATNMHMWHIRKMLLMLCLDFLTNPTKFYSAPRKILKIRPIVGDFFMKNWTHVWGFLAKTDPFLRHVPVCLNITCE